MNQKLDPRLTDWSFEDRCIGHVDKMCDTHIHWNGKRETLDLLLESCEVTNIETMFLIGGHDVDPKEWIKTVDKEFTIGKGAVPFLYLDLSDNDPDQIDKIYDLGFWGLKWIGTKIPLDDLWYDPLLKRADELGMANLYHVGVLAGGRNASGMSLQRADMMDTIAKRYPDMLIQGAHLGEPNIHTAFWASEFCYNLIWDASGGCRFQCQADPRILYAAMHRRKRAWESVTFASDCTQGMYPPEWADGWPSKIAHRMAEWQQILSLLPEPPTSEQLDGFFYENAHNFVERIREKRGE